MAVFINLETGDATSPPTPFVAALGDFDGVHLGHRAVLASAARAAAKLGALGAAWYFEDAPKFPFARITTNAEKERLFKEIPLDLAIRETFISVKDLSPASFLTEYLMPLGCVGVVCGFNFRFGKGAAGDATVLEKLCAEEGLYFDRTDAVELNGKTVSSTAIREYLSSGDVALASGMLGRTYSVSAPVTHGRHIGSALGFPTINQQFEKSKALPRSGVYFTCTKTDGKLFPSVSNVGSRPTVGGHEYRLETYILDYDGDLYGKTPEVFFIKFRRDQMHFSDEEELARAVGADVEAAREFFATHNASGLSEKENGNE